MSDFPAARSRTVTVPAITETIPAGPPGARGGCCWPRVAGASPEPASISSDSVSIMAYRRRWTHARSWPTAMVECDLCGEWRDKKRARCPRCGGDPGRARRLRWRDRPIAVVAIALAIVIPVALLTGAIILLTRELRLPVRRRSPG